MPTLEPKKLALLRIWQILLKHSDYDHPLTQEDIIDYLYKEYGIEMERKAIGKNITNLRDAGIDVGSRRGGSYIDSRDFEDSELRLLIDGVLQSKHITAKHSKDGIDKKLHKTSFARLSPYQLILHNQRYYLMGYSSYWGNMTFHRLDRITNMRVSERPAVPLSSVPGYEKGIDYKQISSTLPYMYTDTPERIEFIADERIVDQIVDWFGLDIKMSAIPDTPGNVKVDLFASPNAMEHWALQYLNYVEVTKPESLRERIKNSIVNAMTKY